MHAIFITGKDAPTSNAEVFFCWRKAYVKQIYRESSCTSLDVENGVAGEHGQSEA
jgi:hypothetical protein